MKKSTHEHFEKSPETVVRLEVGSFKTNCYLVYGSQGNCAVIDPGEDADYIEEKIRNLNLKPKLIIITHGHSDHFLGASDLALAYAIRPGVNQKDAFLLRKEPVLTGLVVWFKEGDILKAGEISLEVLELPGHTPGSAAFRLLGSRYVFCGDLFFADGSLGRTDFGYSDRKVLNKSILRLRKLPQKTIFCPGHGEEFKKPVTSLYKSLV